MKNPFRTRTKTFVDSQTVRIFDDDVSAPTITESILKAVLQGTPMVDEIKDYILTGPIFKLGQFYKYANNKFIDGVPMSSDINIENRLELFKTWLRNRQSDDIEIIYTGLSSIDFVHYAKQKLFDVYNYDGTNNRIKGLEDSLKSKVYVENFELRLPKSLIDKMDLTELTQLVDGVNTFKTLSNYLSYAGINKVVKNYTIIQDDSGFIGTVVNYAYEESYTAIVKNNFGDAVEVPRKRVKEGSLTFPISMPYLGDGETEEGAEEVGYFQAAYRKVGSNETEYFTYEFGSGGYPILDNLFETSDHDLVKNYPIVMLIEDKVAVTSLDKKSERRRSTFMLLRTIGIDLDKLMEGILDNEDIDKIHQVALMMGCPTSSDIFVHKKYLYEYFNKYHLLGQTGSLNSVHWNANSYECEMTHTGIESRIVVSTDAKDMEEYEKEVGDGFFTTTYIDDNGNTRSSITRYKGFLLKKKISDISYREIIVKNPRMRVKVSGTRYAEHNADSKHFLIPIEESLTSTFGINQKNELLFKCLHLQVSTLVTVKVRWYQTKEFGIFLKILAVALTIVSIGKLSPLAVAAFKAGWLVGVVFVAKVVLMAIVFKYGAKYAVEKWGPENAALAALGALITSYFIPGPVKFNGLSFASSYLSLATNLVSAVGTAINTYTEEILKATRSDLEKYQEAFEKLSDLEKELFPSNDVARMIPMIILGESPDAFYNRTIHSSNPGINAINHLTYYVENALIPPTAQQTIMQYV